MRCVPVSCNNMIQYVHVIVAEIYAKSYSEMDTNFTDLHGSLSKAGGWNITDYHGLSVSRELWHIVALLGKDWVTAFAASSQLVR